MMSTKPLVPAGDHKATEFLPFTAASPQIRTFHLSWLNLFSCFFSTFSIPPLIPIIRQDLHLTATDIGAAGCAAFAGAILSRFLMGPICDLVGPRKASGTLSLLTAPIILFTAAVSSPLAFIAIRFLVGFSLANFVANQFWMSSMFSSEVVGSANAVAAGWANTGSGVTQLLMPLFYNLLTSFLPSSTAWRLAFVVPAVFQSVTSVLVLAFGHDNNTNKNKNNVNVKQGPEENVFWVVFRGLTDYRGWIFALLYGFSLGVEMTTDNIIAQYFYDR